jgi:hypothetical protein
MAEEPIIVRGGSVTVDISDKFKDNGSGGGRKKYKNDYGKLLRLQVNDEAPRTLNPGDTVTITVDDGTAKP